jgi:hypothetical protein
MLDVHSRHHVNTGVEDLEHVFAALAVAAAWHVRVCQFVNHADLRLAIHATSRAISVVLF